jgi:hypothetical protein
MIDYFVKYASLAAAKADPLVQAHMDQLQTIFDESRVLINPVVWRASQDVNGVHTPLTGFYLVISLPNLVPALRDAASVQVVIDREKANARQPGAVIKSNLTTAVLQDIRFEPVFAGCDYPFGGWS